MSSNLIQPTIPHFNDDIGLEGSVVTPVSGPSGWEHSLIEGDVPESATSLPLVDTGFDAYAYMVSAWMLELLVWAFPFSYGVFYNYYTRVLFSPNDPQLYLLPIVGTLSSGIIYIGSPLLLPLMLKYPGQKRNMSYLGLLLCVLGLAGAGFSTRPAHLVLTQGVIYSVGGNLLYFPILTYLMEWFSVKRGLANGIIFTGTGLGGMAVPFVTEILFRKYGHRVTFLVFAAIFGGLGLPSVYYAKPRLPAAPVSTLAAIDTSFIKNQIFWVFFASSTAQAFACFLPGIYLPSFASDLQLNTTSGTLALALMNATSIPGLLLIGGMSDKLDLRAAISVSSVGAAVAVLFVWGFTGELGPLLVFACLYGFFSSGFIGAISAEDPHVHSTIMCSFMLSRGLGNVLSGPVSTLLLKHSPLYDTVKFGYGVKGYGPLILFTGFSMLASTFAATYPYFAGQPIGFNVPLSIISR